MSTGGRASPIPKVLFKDRRQDRRVLSVVPQVPEVEVAVGVRGEYEPVGHVEIDGVGLLPPNRLAPAELIRRACALGHDEPSRAPLAKEGVADALDEPPPFRPRSSKWLTARAEDRTRDDSSTR